MVLEKWTYCHHLKAPKNKQINGENVVLILPWQRSLSYRKQFFDLHTKSMDQSLRTMDLRYRNRPVAWNGLTLSTPMPHFYTPWKCQKTFSFLMFSGGWKWNIGVKKVNRKFVSKHSHHRDAVWKIFRYTSEW